MTFYVQPFPHRHSMPRRWMRMADGSIERRLAANVRDEEDAFVLTALVPGLKADDLTINILEEVVSVEGEFPQDENEYLLRELPSGKFSRSLRLPAPVNADKAEAKIADGVLTLRLPKAESARPKKIKIAAK
ncbi:MAG: Hsp20/alpha crystallin family protein [Anaerolineae bacterium CFX3]|jgi:HSP20 family protein|nr:Hsp20/alpha crystallin family protein [Anaerolineales bacterium]MCC7511601.1 Hsp20/alpha crystallin family protein [Anaerolineae bacterium]MCE7905599.1 Hsp20/alpha crystallin family protein [Anaerolineae bacterium CFX3]MCQ3946882.1 Hsp20/alpha crystallin family protein [Anaerolineae bacterium]MCZ2288599.1 Hsp20/alpha crystallin family protein [Anaerolineales bacterium]